MDDSEQEDFQELRRALERLLKQLYEATHALNRLNVQLKEIDGDDYHRHGSPFGNAGNAADVWHRYNQFTTLN